VSTWISKETGSGSGPRVAVKDLIDVAGLPTTAGSRAVADTAVPAARDAGCLAGLRAAIEKNQARYAGKTNLHELAFGITGINDAFGTPVNPLDPRRVPGGSSSGSATAVAAQEADIAYGTDTGGSIRIPAACCGITGLKTTWGRVPLDGVRPLAPSLDTVGPMARTVSGLAAGMALLEPGFTLAAQAPRAVGRLTIDAEPAVSEAVDSALLAAGFEVQALVIPKLAEFLTASIVILEHEAWATNAELVRSAGARIGAAVRDRLQRGAEISPDQLADARQRVADWKKTLDVLWERVELLAAPTLQGFPPFLADAAEMPGIRGLNSLVNAAGVPALALPVPAAGPLPASLQLIGPAYGEDRLLAAGEVVEQARHWPD
jgi:amidase